MAEQQDLGEICGTTGEQTSVKKPKRKSAKVKESVLLGTDHKGRNVYDGPFHGKYVLSSNKDGSTHKSYVTVSVDDNGLLVTKSKIKASGAQKKRKRVEVDQGSRQEVVTQQISITSDVQPAEVPSAKRRRRAHENLVQ